MARVTTNADVARYHFDKAVSAVQIAREDDHDGGATSWALVALAHIEIAKFAEQATRRLNTTPIGRESE